MPFCQSFEAEPDSERIVELRRKLRKLCLFKESHFIIQWWPYRKNSASRIHGNIPYIGIPKLKIELSIRWMMCTSTVHAHLQLSLWPVSVFMHTKDRRPVQLLPCKGFTYEVVLYDFDSHFALHSIMYDTDNRLCLKHLRVLVRHNCCKGNTAIEYYSLHFTILI